MNKVLIFFCCASAILLFTIVNLSIGPIVSKAVQRNYGNWGILNVGYYKNEYDRAKDLGIKDDALKYGAKWELNRATRCKGMHDMEYTSFIFDIVIGFVCGLLGLLNYFGLKNDFIKITGLIGLICGAVGFILTFVYVIFNGLVYTTYDTAIIKTNGDGAYAEKTGNPADNKYKCLYYDKPENTHALYATISDLIKKQYNYDKDLYKTITSSMCYISTYIDNCRAGETFNAVSDCKYFYDIPTTKITNKDISNRFLTTLILSLFVCLANIGLAIFGFLLFKNPQEAVVINFATSTKI